MAHVATPKQPHPITGLANKALCWQITTAAAPDLTECFTVIGTAGYNGNAGAQAPEGASPHNPMPPGSTWTLTITLQLEGFTFTLQGTAGDYVFFDGRIVWKLDADAVAAGWDLVPWTGPPALPPGP